MKKSDLQPGMIIRFNDSELHHILDNGTFQCDAEPTVINSMDDLSDEDNKIVYSMKFKDGGVDKFHVTEVFQSVWKYKLN